MKEYIEIEKLIEAKTSRDELLKLLLNREITYGDYVKAAEKMKIKTNGDIEEEMRKMIIIKERKGLTINELEKMNYLETKSFLRELKRKGLQNETIMDELYCLWDEGKIKGFDYRYTVEALGERVPITFLREAERIGRYYY